eukprot:5243258-Pleurochrysis_carterae.AAC.1
MPVSATSAAISSGETNPSWFSSNRKLACPACKRADSTVHTTSELLKTSSHVRLLKCSKHFCHKACRRISQCIFLDKSKFGSSQSLVVR